MNFNEWLEQQKDGIAACDHVTFGRKVWEAGQEELGQQLAAKETECSNARAYDCALIYELEQQLAEREKQIVMLREALRLTKEQAIDCRMFPAIASPEFWPNAVEAALAAADDLSGCILCDAEPAGTFLGCVEEGKAFQATHPNAYPLYKELAK